MTTTHTSTHATRNLLELERLVSEIEGQLLSFASSGARLEWTRFRESCSTAATATARTFGTLDDDSAILVSKARRFRAVILLA